MLDKEELSQVRDYVIGILPELLQQEPEIATAIEGILAHQFPRRDEFARLLDELTALRKDSNQSFKQVDQRFEDVKKDNLNIKMDIAKLQHGQEIIIKRLDHQDMWFKFLRGDLGKEKGQALEDMVAIALGYGLRNPHLSPQNIRLRQKLVDTAGQVFKAGFSTEIDLIVEDDKVTVFDVFEIKATIKIGDVDFFALKVELIALQNPDKQVHGVMIAPLTWEGIEQRCREHGLELLSGPRMIEP